MPGCAGSVLRSRSKYGSAASGLLRIFQFTIAIWSTMPGSAWPWRELVASCSS